MAISEIKLPEDFLAKYKSIFPLPTTEDNQVILGIPPSCNSPPSKDTIFLSCSTLHNQLGLSVGKESKIIDNDLIGMTLITDLLIGMRPRIISDASKKIIQYIVLDIGNMKEGLIHRRGNKIIQRKQKKGKEIKLTAIKKKKSRSETKFTRIRVPYITKKIQRDIKKLTDIKGLIKI